MITRRRREVWVGDFGKNVAAAVLALALAASAAAGQSVLERSPNLSGGWVGSPGVLHFNFLHRFDRSDAPQRKVSNAPTFLLAAGLPGGTLIGVNYATSSDVAPRFPNEWEFFGRYLPLAQEAGAALDVGVQAGYNLAAASWDGEVALGRWIGPVRLMAAGRGMSNGYYAGETRFAWAGGVDVRVARFVALSGDVASLVDRREGEQPAWGAGLQLAIPYTPHSLSLHATNTNTATLQGASRGGTQVRYGFEFTIPVTLSRYLRRRPEPVAGAALPATAAPRDSTAAARGTDPVAPVAGGDSAAAAPPGQTASPRPPPDTAAPPPPPGDTAAPAPAPDTVAPAPPADTVARTPAARTPERVERPRPAAAQRPAAPARLAATIRQFAFLPARLEVKAGTTITWTNEDPVAHTVTADEGAFDSGVIAPGATWRHTFDRPGTYPYHCTPHPFMQGVVVVR